MYSRHDLVWLTPRGWAAALARALPGEHEAIERWQRHGWPLVVRRDETGAAPDSVCLGLALPPDAAGVKRRIALHALESDIVKRAPALPLPDAAAQAPLHWRPAIDTLAQSLPLRAFGSLALQVITGQSYLTAKSDIDLLFHPTTRSMLDAGLSMMSASPLPLDGEIVFPSGDAVAWKEWAGAERVLVKRIASVRLAPVAELLATLEDA